jgi:hypothetical protein
MVTTNGYSSSEGGEREHGGPSCTHILSDVRTLARYEVSHRYVDSFRYIWLDDPSKTRGVLIHPPTSDPMGTMSALGICQILAVDRGILQTS